jgi:hypothetical protein
MSWRIWGMLVVVMASEDIVWIQVRVFGHWLTWWFRP